MRTTSGLPILLLALAGSVVGVSWLSLAHDPVSRPVVIVEPDDAAGRPVSETPGLIREFAPQAGEQRSSTTLAEATAQSTAELPSKQARPDSERGLREKFLALEAAQPGYLQAHSQEWLSEARPIAEKVAWLQALQRTDASAALPWFEFTCRCADPAGAQGLSPAAYAAESLASLSVKDAGARAALGRVAFDAASVDVSVRRRAASSFASLGDAADLETLAQALLLERDEALRAGVVVSLEARGEPEIQLAAARLLAWLRPGSAAYLARQADGTP